MDCLLNDSKQCSFLLTLHNQQASISQMSDLETSQTSDLAMHNGYPGSSGGSTIGNGQVPPMNQIGDPYLCSHTTSFNN